MVAGNKPGLRLRFLHMHPGRSRPVACIVLRKNIGVRSSEYFNLMLAMKPRILAKNVVDFSAFGRARFLWLSPEISMMRECSAICKSTPPFRFEVPTADLLGFKLIRLRVLFSAIIGEGDPQGSCRQLYSKRQMEIV